MLCARPPTDSSDIVVWDETSREVTINVLDNDHGVGPWSNVSLSDFGYGSQGLRAAVNTDSTITLKAGPQAVLMPGDVFTFAYEVSGTAAAATAGRRLQQAGRATLVTVVRG